MTFRGDAGATRVEVEHRGWDDLGPDGPDQEAGFGGGWPAVLDAFEQSAAGRG